MKDVDEKLMIIRQSSLKSAADLANIVGYKPENLKEFLRFTDIIVDYAVAGLSPDVKKEIDKFDNILKQRKNGKT